MVSDPDAARHSRVKELFLAALEQPMAAREEFLLEACRGDVALWNEVQEMLGADTVAGPGGDPAPDSAEVRGERAYRRLSELGRGGMGVVYLAERADGEYSQRVAIKVLRGGRLVGDALQQRFRAERQILARLEHPNIARLLDGGSDRDGSPFLVMEYVEGEPIDRFCEQRSLAVEARLRLFVTVCEAVQEAHRRLVVHRDLKPSNILVTTAGVPKLLDFGIAKMLDPAAAEWTVAETRQGEQPLTPRYASPEQVLGEPVTTATDIYSLGVVLYELLTGLSPYDVSLSAHRLARAICEDDPPAPSTAVTRPGGTGTGAASAEELVRRARRLRGDLDAIVLKALRKDPRARYASAEQLAADIERHLAGLPVLARAGGLRYRGGKFVRRNWASLGVAATFLTLVVAFSVDRQLQLDRTASERDKARAAIEFLVDLFELADPSEARGNTITVREALDRGAARIDSELAGQPETRATLLEAVGRVYHNLGLFAPARESLGRAVELRRAGGDSAALATALEFLARPTQAAGDLAAAEQLLQRAIEAVPAGRGTLRAFLLSAQARLYLDQGRFAAGRDLQATAYRELAASGDASELDLAQAAAAWVIAIQAAADGAASAAQIELAARHLVAAGNADPIRVAMVRGEIALTRRGIGESAAALPEFDRAIEELEPVVPEGHVELANLLNNRAIVRADLGDFAGAIEDLERSRTMWTALVGREHPRTALATANLGAVAVRRGDWLRARALLDEGLELGLATLPPSHPDLGKDYQILADVELELGNRRRAAELLELARPIVDSESAPLTIAEFEARQGRHLLRRGELAAAEQLSRRALERAQTALPGDSASLATFELGLARVELALDDAGAARELLEAAVAKRLEALGPDHHETALSRALLGRALFLAGERGSRPRELLEGALSIQDRRLAPAHFARAETRLWLAEVLERDGERERALAVVDEALDDLLGSGLDQHYLLAPLRTAQARMMANIHEA